MGYPLTEEVCAGDAGCTQDFQGGTLTWHPSTGVTVTYNQPGEYQRVINKRNPLSPIDYAPSDMVNVGGHPPCAIRQHWASGSLPTLQVPRACR